MCSFYNNTAVAGGAISFQGRTIEVNSWFELFSILRLLFSTDHHILASIFEGNSANGTIGLNVAIGGAIAVLPPVKAKYRGCYSISLR